MSVLPGPRSFTVPYIIWGNIAHLVSYVALTDLSMISEESANPDFIIGKVS